MDEQAAVGKHGPGPLRAGVAKSDITISDESVPVHDPLYAKALVLDNGETQVAIIAMDVVAIGTIFDVSDEFLPELRARIEGELGIPGAHVLVNASHTHPPRKMLCPHAEQVERTLDAVRRAQEGMVEVRIGVGVGHEDRFVINRTLRLKDGKGWTIRQANPCPPDEEVAGLGPVDPEIGILRVDRAYGRPLAVVYNYACHPLIGMPGGPVTANFPGFASELIEDCLGEGAMALFLQGAGGDITEVLYKAFWQPRDSRPLGMMLGHSTIKALAGIESGDDTRLKVVPRTIRLPRRTDIPERIAELEAEREGLLNSLAGMALNFRSFLPLYLQYSLNPEWPADYSYRYLQAEARGSNEITALDELNRHNIAKYLHNIRAMERIARIQSNIGTLRSHQAFNDASGEDTIAAEVQGIRIGECVLITSPAEVLTRVGLRVKRASPHRYTFMAAFSNGYLHYGPPADEYPMGGYEVTECLLAPEWQEIYEQTAAEVLAQL
ncbi:MAG: hypothetical protein AB7Y46_04265 [Armatimonadota bacterium]